MHRVFNADLNRKTKHNLHDGLECYCAKMPKIKLRQSFHCRASHLRSAVCPGVERGGMKKSKWLPRIQLHKNFASSSHLRSLVWAGDEGDKKGEKKINLVA